MAALQMHKLTEMQGCHNVAALQTAISQTVALQTAIPQMVALQMAIPQKPIDE